jgi:prevent-host-death family protein
MKTIPLVDIKEPLNTYVKEVQNQGPIVITSNGKAIAVLIAPIDDDDLENLLLSHSSELQNILNQSRQSIKMGKGLTTDTFWARVENSVEDSESENDSP